MLLRLHPPHTCGLRRTRSHASPAEAPAFHWKGAGDGRGQAWLNAALETRGGYVTDGAGYQLFYADCGPEDGQPLVLIHGFPGYSYLWRNSVAALAAAGRRVIALDLLGCGNSDKPEPSSFVYSVAAHVACLEHVLFSSLKLQRGGIDVAAQGLLGGTIGAVLAAQGCVRRLALFNVPLTPEATKDLPQPLRFLLNPFLAPLSAQNPVALVSGPIEAAGIYRIDPNDIAAYIAPSLQSGDAGWAAIAIAKALRRDGPAATASAVAALAERGADVLIVWGAADKWLGGPPPADVLPCARRIVLSEAGHFVAEDWSDKCTEALLQL